jgi:hypothetical protein
MQIRKKGGEKTIQQECLRVWVLLVFIFQHMVSNFVSKVLKGSLASQHVLEKNYLNTLISKPHFNIAAPIVYI